MGLGASALYTVHLSAPAAAGGVAVSLGLAPAAVGTIPAGVVVPEGQQSAVFQFTAAAAEGAGTITATLGAVSVQAQVIVQAAPSLAGLVINEVAYDTIGSADSTEFVEIHNTTLAAIPLANVALVFVNGSNGNEYLRSSLGSLGSLAAGGYLVVGSATLVAATPPGTQTRTTSNNIIQNGTPDGLALIDTAGQVVLDALSYEGSIPAANITGLPFAVNLVEGTPAPEVDSNTVAASLARIPNGTDTNDAFADWLLSATPTPGSANAP